MRGPATNRGTMCGTVIGRAELAVAHYKPVDGRTTMGTAAVEAPAANRFKLWIVWAGRVVSVAPVYILLWSARAKLTHSLWYVREWSRIGWSPDALNGVGAIQLTCLALYLIPQTAVLGPSCSPAIWAAPLLRTCAWESSSLRSSR